MGILESALGAYHAFEVSTLAWVTGIVTTYGGLGVLVGMFFESSFLPLPSEPVLIAAGALGIDPITVTIYGTIGSTFGAMVGYLIGLKGGRPLVKKIGPWFRITEERLVKVEDFANRHGSWGVFAARLLPIIPFKVFSIGSGIARVPFKSFVFFTFLGTIPRAFFLAWLGSEIVKYQGATVALVAVVVCAVGIYYFVNSRKKTASKTPVPSSSNKK